MENVNIIFFDFSQLTEISYFRKTKIKENIIFSIISDIFRNISVGKDFDDKQLIE